MHDVILLPSQLPTTRAIVGDLAHGVNDVASAVATSQPISAASAGDWWHLPAHWPAQADLLNICQTMGPGIAVVLIVLGIIFLLFGWNVFKTLVTLNAVAVGAYIGAIAGQASDTAVPAAIVGGLLFGALTWPVMKYAIAVMGGIFGALLGVSIWRLCGQDPTFAWAGAGMGMIFFGLLSFILFRTCVVTFMSLQGAVMLVFGVLGLIFQYQGFADHLTQSFTLRPFLLPMVIFIPTLFGIIYQQAMYPAGAPAPAGKK